MTDEQKAVEALTDAWFFSFDWRNKLPPGMKENYEFRFTQVVAALTAASLSIVATAEIERLRVENDTLRGLLARGDKDCPYCGLPAADIARCASGFPGCGRMDDITAADAARAALKEMDNGE